MLIKRSKLYLPSIIGFIGVIMAVGGYVMRIMHWQNALIIYYSGLGMLFITLFSIAYMVIRKHLVK